MLIHKAMKKIIDEYWRLEYEDWEDKNNPEDHIFMSLNSLKNHLEAEHKKELKIKEMMDYRSSNGI